jgi:hydrogenase expression/formation protein HypC
MCLGIPMSIIEIDGFVARCEARGIERQVNLFLMQHESLAPGDNVLVHVGNAIQKINDEEVEGIWEVYDEILSPEHGDEADA